VVNASIQQQLQHNKCETTVANTLWDPPAIWR